MIEQWCLFSCALGLLGTISEEKLLGHMEVQFLVSWGMSKLFSKKAGLANISTVNEHSFTSKSMSTLDVSVLCERCKSFLCKHYYLIEN